MKKNPDGTFAKGNEGGGRPKADKTGQNLARQYSVEAIHTLYEIMSNVKTKDRDRIIASNSILDRAFGKPPQAKQEGEDDVMQGTQIVVSVSMDEYEQMKKDQKENDYKEEDDY